MDFTTLTTDPTAEVKGVWCKFEDAEFLIASSNSTKYRRALGRRGKSEAGGLRRADPTALDRVTIEAMADGILLDWRGNVQWQGKELPYSRENSLLLLGIPPFREWVATQASDLSNFQTESEEAAKGALKSGSGVEPPVGS